MMGSTGTQGDSDRATGENAGDDPRAPSQSRQASVYLEPDRSLDDLIEALRPLVIMDHEVFFDLLTGKN